MELKFDSGKKKYTLIPVEELIRFKKIEHLEYDSLSDAYKDVLEYKNIGALKCIYDYCMFNSNEIEELASLYSYGAKMHHEESWREITDANRWIDALGRHLFHYKEYSDSESGIKHSSHAAWNALTAFIHLTAE